MTCNSEFGTTEQYTVTNARGEFGEGSTDVMKIKHLSKTTLSNSKTVDIKYAVVENKALSNFFVVVMYSALLNHNLAVIPIKS